MDTALSYFYVLKIMKLIYLDNELTKYSKTCVKRPFSNRQNKGL